MKVVRVLGSERVYLMSDGSKIPFEDRHIIFNKTAANTKPARGEFSDETVTIEEAVEVLEQKPKKKRKYTKRKKKEL